MADKGPFSPIAHPTPTVGATTTQKHHGMLSAAAPLQAPDLTLVPAVAAPGAYINVKTMTDDSTYVSGTSFSSPYTAGLIAMWLQVRQSVWDDTTVVDNTTVLPST